MYYPDYYRALDLHVNASLEEIKKAYRKKARLYHPDLNHSPDAKDKFIQVTEAYEFLIANFEKLSNDEETFRRTMENWTKYRQARSRQRAHAYAHSSYARFTNTKFYRTTRIFDFTGILFSLIFSIIIILYAIVGYIYRLKNPIPELQNPLLTFIMLMILGMLFFIISLVYLKAYQETSKRHRKNPA